MSPRYLRGISTYRRWVRGGQHGGSAVEHGGDARLRDGDGLLLHRLVDGDAVFVAHLVELVYADAPSVRQHHRAAREHELSVTVLDDGRGETRGGGTLAGGVHAYGRRLVHELEKLRLGGGRIAHEEHVDVAAQPRAVRGRLPRTAEQQGRHRRFDVVAPEDGGRDARANIPDDLAKRSSRKRLKLRLFCVGEVRVAARTLRLLHQTNHAKVRLLNRRAAAAAAPAVPFPAAAAERIDAHDDDAGPRDDALHEVPLDAQRDVSRHLARGDVLGVLLQFEGLLVHELGLLRDDDEWVHAASAVRGGVGVRTAAPVAHARYACARVAAAELEVLDGAARLALHGEPRGF